MRSILFIVVVALIGAAAACAQTSPTATTKPAQEMYPALDVRLIDKSVDPCQDFYQYACGNWIKNNEIPPDRDSWSVFAQVADRAELALRDILEKAAVDHPQRSAVDQKIGDYYAACMDEKTINQLGSKPL